VLSVIRNPKIWPLIYSPFLVDISQIFRDGRSPEGLPSPIKRTPKIASGFPYLKGKVRVWGTPNHLKLDFGVKNGWKRFLGQK